MRKQVLVVDYRMGNISSIINMLRRVGATAVASSRPSDVEAAERLILPGVGSFDAGMRQINELGIAEVLREKVVDRKTPILGLCLGMQLMTRGSDEGELSGLGWIDGHTIRFAFEPEDVGLKIPHMGWNNVDIRQEGTLFRGFLSEPRFYFVHSYHVVCGNPADILATTHHGCDFVSALEHENIMGTQFHPEKSHKFGMRLLDNFVELT